MGFRRAVFDLVAGRCPSTGAPVARGLQRGALARASWGALADAAQRLPAVGRCLSADPALDCRGKLRSDCPRPAGTAAGGPRADRPALGGDFRRADAAIDAREWGAGGLRWAQAEERS